MQPFASSIDALQADVLQASDHLVDTVISTELGSRVVRQIYILTYSQANLEFFPTRQSFAEAVLYAFGDSPANILQWVCAREEHSNGGLAKTHLYSAQANTRLSLLEMGLWRKSRHK